MQVYHFDSDGVAWVRAYVTYQIVRPSEYLTRIAFPDLVLQTVRVVLQLFPGGAHMRTMRPDERLQLGCSFHQYRVITYRRQDFIYPMQKN